MKITYDPEANAAYISVLDPIPDGAATTQIHSIMTPGDRGEIILDFDTDGHLLGVEILQANQVLPPSVLATASTIGPTGTP